MPDIKAPHPTLDWRIREVGAGPSQEIIQTMLLRVKHVLGELIEQEDMMAVFIGRLRSTPIGRVSEGKEAI